MPYPAGNRAAVRKRIIDSARKLFDRHGFECVSPRRAADPGGECDLSELAGDSLGTWLTYLLHPPVRGPIYLKPCVRRHRFNC